MVTVLAPWLPSRKKWSRREYAQLVDHGVLSQARVELIEGDLIEKAPQASAHAGGVRRAEEALRAAFPQGHDVRCQLPLAVDEFCEPEPDLAVVLGHYTDYEIEHPCTAVLVVEVADTSLAVDRAKATIYARAGVTEYWIVNLRDRCLEVYLDPSVTRTSTATDGPLSDREEATREQPGRRTYARVVTLPESATICPSAAPTCPMTVGSLLPRQAQP